MQINTIQGWIEELGEVLGPPGPRNFYRQTFITFIHAKTGVQEDDEGAGDGKEDSTFGGEGTEMDFVGVYHEHRTPILSVLFERSTMFPKYCVAHSVFS